MDPVVFRLLLSYEVDKIASDVKIIPMSSKDNNWWVEAGGSRAGRVRIEQADRGPSLQIFLNKKHQGRKIGRVANRLAAEASGHNSVFATLRKSNVASRRALEEAGFKDVTSSKDRQMLMRWDKE